MSDFKYVFEGMDDYQNLIDAGLQKLKNENVIERIWKKDYTLWSDKPDEITNRLGWLLVTDNIEQKLEELEKVTSSVVTDGYKTVVLLGMGGSSLAPEVFRKTFGYDESRLDLKVLDSTHPDAVLALKESLVLETTLFVVSTKSGGTVETLSFFKYFYRVVCQALGQENAGHHFIAITDPGSKLQKMAKVYGFRHTFINDPNIGGRFSALSYFGLVPASLIGVDLKALMTSAQSMLDACKNTDSMMENPGALIGALIGMMAEHGKDKLTFLNGPEFTSFGDWVEQLIAESTGKHGKGILPIVTESAGSPTVYGSDRLFVRIGLHPGGIPKNHPGLIITLNDLNDLGALFVLWEMATALSGYFLKINPFDQPNVESAKVLGRKIVAEYLEKGELEQDKQNTLSKDRLEQFLSDADEGDYIALQAYIPHNEENTDLLLQLGNLLRDNYKLAVTVGFGPRFLHSTGQLHKGDSGNGHFIQLLNTSVRDAGIPDDADADQASMPFSVLVSAQAKGDRQALLDAGRHVVYFTLGKDIKAEIQFLLNDLT